jgi:catechol 2,3-dioxygenase-like lactoylglutathione lyase family enzyme
MDATDRSDRAPSLTLPGPITTLLGNSRPLPATEADMTSIGRIHHITAIASAPDRNLAFYEGALGLRMIEETDAASDADAANILTAWSRQLDKNLWCLEAHLHGGGDRPGARPAKRPWPDPVDPRLVPFGPRGDRDRRRLGRRRAALARRNPGRSRDRSTFLVRLVVDAAGRGQLRLSPA